MPTTTAYPWLDELNPRQREAVTYGNGPLLVIAGAGTGKTRTLAYRVAYLMAEGVAPERILLLTFTRRAAEEMLRRAAAIAARDRKSAGQLWGGTFHATANRLLRFYAKATGLNPDFTVMDASDAEDMLNVIRHEMGLHRRAQRFPRKSTCLAIYSRCVNGAEALTEILTKEFPWCREWQAELKELFKTYVGRKQQHNVLDYDDLLLYWMHMMADPALGATIGGRFDHILVDEYQDTNRIQADILLGMRRRIPNITVVGDDAQSIYSFRAATIRNILDFPQQFPGAHQVTLDRNYRSTKAILETTNRLIAPARERYAKDLWSDRGAGERPRLVMCTDEDRQNTYVSDRLLEHYEAGIPLKRQAVLFRAGHLADTLEIELTRRNIPYHKYGGLRFLEAGHVKDIVCLLRIAENPRDEMAWFRTLQLLDGVGPATAGQAIRHVAAHGFDPRSVATYAAPAAAREGLAGLAAMLIDVLAQENNRPASQVERVRRFYDPILAKRYENPTVRARDLENLEQIASGYRSRSAFLTDLQLDPPNATSDLAGPPAKDEDWLNLSTIHSAKGCEWDVVFLIHAADGVLPSDMATGSDAEIEEERRLTYVATTRARDFLYITWPLRYYHARSRFTDRHTYAQPCRFLTDAVMATCERITLNDPDGDDDRGGPGASTFSTNIRARLRDMWD